MAGTWKAILPWIAAGVVGATGLAQPSERGSTSDPTLLIRVYDVAGVPRTTWVEAVREAQHIFRQAKTETSWAKCSRPQGEVAQDDPCRGGVGIPALTLRILPQFIAVSPGLSDLTTGFALIPSEFKAAAHAGVFYDRVELQTRWGILSTGQMLALVAAHELGHLLLNTHGHAKTGIMQARWGPEELHLATQHALNFTKQERALIRDAVLAGAEVAQDSPGRVSSRKAWTSLTFLPVSPTLNSVGGSWLQVPASEMRTSIQARQFSAPVLARGNRSGR